MSVTTIIFIILALLAGGAAVWFFLRKKENRDEAQIKALTSQVGNLRSKLADAEGRANSAALDSARSISEIKSKYDALLDEANEQCQRLDAQLKNAMDGILDDSVKAQLQEAVKLKKKIKNLEEELEESEDNVADIRRKLRNKDADIECLQDSVAREQKVASQLREDLVIARQKLDQKTDELRIKVGSLEFIQDILSAPEADTSDIKQINDYIAEVKSFALGQLMDCFAILNNKNISLGEGNFENFKSYWQQRFYEWASIKKKNWISGKKTIAFVGEFSAGKTSIVNRILSQDDPNVPLLPVSTKATTAIATYIAGGPELSFRYVTPDDKLRTISQETFTEKISKEFLDQVRGAASLIQYFVMTYRNPHLNGISILDTPGFNSNDKDDAKRTMEVINECDALFWVFDVNAGTINRSSIAIIKQHLNKPLYVVINKVDTKSEFEIQQVEEHIRWALRDEGLKVEECLRFSTKTPLDNLMYAIKEVRHTTDKEQYITDLGDSIDKTLNLLEAQVEQASREYREAETKGQEIDDKFILHKKVLAGRCNAAACIPNYTKHLFKKNNYEMTQEEFTQLSGVLEQSRADVEKMGRIYEEKTNSSYEIQQTWTALSDAKNAWQRVNDLKIQYNKLLNRPQI